MLNWQIIASDNLKIPSFVRFPIKDTAATNRFGNKFVSCINKSQLKQNQQSSSSFGATYHKNYENNTDIERGRE